MQFWGFSGKPQKAAYPWSYTYSFQSSYNVAWQQKSSLWNLICFAWVTMKLLNMEVLLVNKILARLKSTRVASNISSFEPPTTPGLRKLPQRFAVLLSSNCNCITVMVGSVILLQQLQTRNYPHFAWLRAQINNKLSTSQICAKYNTLW